LHTRKEEEALFITWQFHYTLFVALFSRKSRWVREGAFSASYVTARLRSASESLRVAPLLIARAAVPTRAACRSQQQQPSFLPYQLVSQSVRVLRAECECAPVHVLAHQSVTYLLPTLDILNNNTPPASVIGESFEPRETISRKFATFLKSLRFFKC